MIHAGDLTNNGSLRELRKTMDWICNADFEIKIIVAGPFLSYSMPMRPIHNHL